MIANSRKGMLEFVTAAQARVLAQAYIDPGSGALLWQLLVAALVGVLFFLRRLNPKRHLRNWFRK